MEAKKFLLPLAATAAIAAPAAAEAQQPETAQDNIPVNVGDCYERAFEDADGKFPLAVGRPELEGKKRELTANVGTFALTDDYGIACNGIRTFTIKATRNGKAIDKPEVVSGLGDISESIDFTTKAKKCENAKYVLRGSVSYQAEGGEKKTRNSGVLATLTRKCVKKTVKVS